MTNQDINDAIFLIYATRAMTADELLPHGHFCENELNNLLQGLPDDALARAFYTVATTPKLYCLTDPVLAN